MINISWEDVHSRLNEIFIKYRCKNREYKVYGIPKGGMIVAGFLAEYPCFSLVDDPQKADIIFDDLVDSGRTKKYYIDNHPHAIFEVLIDKQKDNIQDWISFPWETDRKDDIEDNLFRILQYYEKPTTAINVKSLNNQIETFVKGL